MTTYTCHVTSADLYAKAHRGEFDLMASKYILERWRRSVRTLESHSPLWLKVIRSQFEASQRKFAKPELPYGLATQIRKLYVVIPVGFPKVFGSTSPFEEYISYIVYYANCSWTKPESSRYRNVAFVKEKLQPNNSPPQVVWKWFRHLT